MSLSKIPVAFIVGYALKTSLQRPHAPASKEERVISADVGMQSSFNKLVEPAGKLEFAAAMLEIITILAWNYPPSLISKTILSMLVFNGGRPDHLYLSTITAIGAALIVTGTLIRFVTFRYLGKFFRFEISIQSDHQLVVSGPYSVIRHPSYAGLFLSQPGMLLWHLGRGAWVRESGLLNTTIGRLFIFGYLVAMGFLILFTIPTRIRMEDEALRRKFGDKWDKWAKNVPYSLVPGIY